MFKNDPKKLLPDAENNLSKGVKNEITQTKDSVLISIWDIKGSQMRYRRMISTLVPHPPIIGDERCYVSHTGNAVYWIGYAEEFQGKAKLIVYDHIFFDYNDPEER